MRFFFGSGWWIGWYLVFYAGVLLFVGGTLMLFAQEIKPVGTKPDTASPGSLLVFLVALTLGALTLVNGLLLAGALDARWYVKVGVAVGLAALVAGVGFPIGGQLALAQSRAWLYANVVYAALAVLLNLTLMWLAQTRPSGSISLLGR